MFPRTLLVWTTIFANLFISADALVSAVEIKPKIGLVLSGGGAKGLAHVGVLKLIDSLQIPVDYVAGTSMGGLIGALYAIGYTGQEIENIVRTTAWDELFTDQPSRQSLPYLQKQKSGRYQVTLGLDGFTPVIPSGLIGGQKLSMLFSRLTADYEGVHDFDELPIPFRCVTADLVSGDEVILSSGSLAKSMRATMSIPSIFSPVEWGDSLLIDGGIINNFPVDVAERMGAELIIGVNVGAPLKPKEELDNILDVFEQAFFLSGEKKIEENKARTDILISPDLEEYTAADFTADDVLAIMKKGDEAANRMRPILKEMKNKYRLKPPGIFEKTIKSPLIHRIDIRGYKTISFSFIYNYLDIRPGQVFNADKIEKRIKDLYALGYFDLIDYRLENVDEKKVALTFYVREKPLRQLHIGFHYDDFHQFVGAVSVSGTDLFVQGLRFENELQFAGVTRFNLQLYLNSRGLNFPVYPFIRFYFKDDPVNIYDLQGPKIASYKDRSLTLMAGFGFTPYQSLNITCALAAEYMNIKPDIALLDPVQFPRFRDDLYQVRINSEIDVIDDILIPRRGYHLQAIYEASHKRLNSDIEYTRYEISGEFYITPAHRHTFMFGGTHVGTGKNLPIYKAYYFGGVESFVGLDYNQLITDHAEIIRFFYRFEFKRDIFLKILYNAAFDYRTSTFRPPTGYIMSGYGISIKFLSIIGPLELTYARGEFSPYLPGEKQTNFYVTAGYKF